MHQTENKQKSAQQKMHQGETTGHHCGMGSRHFVLWGDKTAQQHYAVRSSDSVEAILYIV